MSIFNVDVTNKAVIGVCVKNAIRQLFSMDSLEISVRSQVCNVVCLLMTTIHQIYAVFYAGDGDSSQPGMCLSLVTVLMTIKSKGRDACYIAACVSQTRGQKHFTVNQSINQNAFI